MIGRKEFTPQPLVVFEKENKAMNKNQIKTMKRYMKQNHLSPFVDDGGCMVDMNVSDSYLLDGLKKASAIQQKLLRKVTV